MTEDAPSRVDPAWWAFVAARAIPGVEEVVGEQVRRPVPTADGWATATVRRAGPAAVLSAPDGATAAVRRWVGLDADHAAAEAALADDPTIGPLWRARPDLRVPGTVDPAELALRTVLGQQVSVAAARTLGGRLVALLGEPGPDGLRVFPRPAAIADAGPEAVRAIGLTQARARAVVGLAAALADGLDLTPGMDVAGARRALLALPGIGPWTADYVALRGLRDLDAFPAHDLVLRRRLGDVDPAAALLAAERWRPWRGYAAAAPVGRGLTTACGPRLRRPRRRPPPRRRARPSRWWWARGRPDRAPRG